MNIRTDRIREIIYGNPGISRKKLREMTSLDSRTIMRGLEQLLRQGLIRAETEVFSDRVGRPCEVYYPNDATQFHVVGIYLDLSSIMCVVSEASGLILDFQKEPFALEQASVNHAARRCAQLLKRLERKHHIKISSVGFTIRDRRGARFLVQAERMIKRLIGVPVYSGYPIDAFAWALRRKYPEKKRILTIHFHYEVEICLIDDEKVDDSGRAFGAKLLHIQADPNGPACWCGGNGCLENYINEYMMMEEFRYQKKMPPAEVMNLHEYCLDGDPVAVKILAKDEECIELALKKTAREFKPDLMVLIVLEDDHLIRMMKTVAAGTWIPRGQLGEMSFLVYENNQQSGYACVCATAERALLHEQNLRFKDSTV